VSAYQPTLEASFSLQRSWASPFEAFLQTCDRFSCFQLIFRSGAFPTGLAAYCRRFNGLIPHAQPFPLVPPGGLVQVGASASLGLPTSWVLPQLKMPRSLSLFGSPHALASNSVLPRTRRGTSGYPSPVSWLSPLERGADPSGLSHRRSRATYLGCTCVATYFFGVTWQIGYPIC
jgi:hypothetical protein